MSDQQWYVLTEEHVGQVEKTVSIRAWRPGDGLTCAHVNQAKSIRCTSPIAVIRHVERRAQVRVDAFDEYLNSRYATSRNSLRSSSKSRNVCASHLAAAVRSETGAGSPAAGTSAIIRAAQEQVIAAHWDEYQQTIEALRAAARDAAFDALPDDLRVALEAIDSEVVS